MERDDPRSPPLSIEELFQRFPSFSKAFTAFHKELLDMSVGNLVKPTLDNICRLDGKLTTKQDLKTMSCMVKLEFVSALEKELEKPKDLIKTASPLEPHPFDVCLMERTLYHTGTSGIAVCMPLRGGRKPSHGNNDKQESLCWYDGVDTAVPLEDWRAVRKLSSLSGPARVLENLCERPDRHPVMNSAMMRTDIVQVSQQNHDDDGTDDSVTESMNQSQKAALATVASTAFSFGFVVIQGPPGTGKTATLVGMIAQLEQGAIATAPSNAAVANIALKLFASGRFSIQQLCVFGENCDETVQFLNPVYRWRAYKKFMWDYEEMEDDEKKEQARAKFAKWLHLDYDASSGSSTWTESELQSGCPPAHRDSREGSAVLAKCFADSKVILSTVNSSASPFLRDAAMEKFPTLILDEAGQCTEAEFYITTTFPGVKRIIVVGDPKQLPSTVIDRDCKLAGFGESWLGRVFSLDPRRVHLLNTQYRMHPEILAFPNKHFYQNRIQSAVSQDSVLENIFQFVDTNGRGREELQDQSWKNVYEAILIRMLLHNDRDIVRVCRETPMARVMIITPYRAQVELLRTMIVMKNVLVEVSTVDSVQGQEAEIVLISLVRTKKVGFTDDAQRLNVALTRSKRVLRVVGDLRFFLSLGRGSTLRALAQWAEKMEQVKRSDVKNIPWCPPDWQQFHHWKVVFTAKFHFCLHQMKERCKNIALNTLSAVAKPNLGDLYAPPPKRDSPSWILSCLKECSINGSGIYVVWMAKKLRDLATIEGHFAGSRGECLKFIQQHPELPDGACHVRADLLGVIESNEETSSIRRSFVASWPLTNNIQKALGTDRKLPRGRMQLDDHQEQVASSRPPLLIESRSGTGKTLVLLQHAAFFGRADDDHFPACFVTVSPRLRDELRTQYEELHGFETNGLPPTLFFSLKDLIEALLQRAEIRDFNDTKRRCSFLEYVSSRESYERMEADENLMESEIGGVIMGSLVAARQNSPLSREQYLDDKRSNIPNKDSIGVQSRKLVYDEYERYSTWKRKSKKFDLSDIVLRLLTVDFGPLFSSAYLDEVQDLTHAMIFMICRSSGKESLHWVCAGDGCQMISPGCSFTFDGLKDTLLSVQPGIESRLSIVSHLLVNYRTTLDILCVGNDILRVAKETFPTAIEFALPEIAKKDLGLKVVLCEWSDALNTKVAFGENQALIYSSVGSHDTETELQTWLANHPFILSSLESKGLEFEDVVVAFDLDRKVWDVSRKSVASLRMLRELYVAVTRAQRRVVILVKKSVPTMTSFFRSLHYEFECVEDAHDVFKEFDKKTTPAAWFEQGNRLLGEERFRLAANCFAKAGQDGWLFFARGSEFEETGIHSKAVTAFREAVRHFHKAEDYQNVLKAMCKVATNPSLTWDHDDDKYIDIALRNMPTYLTRSDIVMLALLRGKWTDIVIGDVSMCFELFRSYRDCGDLKRMVRDCSDEDRSEVANVLPELVGDFHLSQHNNIEAIHLYIKARELISVENSALSWIDSLCTSPESSAILGEAPAIVRLLQAASRNHRFVDDRISLMLDVFLSPTQVSKPKLDQFCRIFGRNMVLCAIGRSNDDRLYLYDFNRKLFKLEINEALALKFANNILYAVLWFMIRTDKEGADLFRSEYLGQTPGEQILLLLIDLKVQPSPLFHIVESQTKLFVSALSLILKGTELNESQKNQLVDSYIDFSPSGTVKEIAESAFWEILMGISISLKLERLGCVVLSRLFSFDRHDLSDNLKLASFYCWCQSKWVENCVQGAALKAIASDTGAHAAPSQTGGNGKVNKKIKSKSQRRKKYTTGTGTGLDSLKSPQPQKQNPQSKLDVLESVSRKRESALVIVLILCAETRILLEKADIWPSLLVQAAGPDVALYTWLHDWSQYSEVLLKRVSEFHSELREKVADSYDLRLKVRQNRKALHHEVLLASSQKQKRDETVRVWIESQSRTPRDSTKGSQFAAFHSQLKQVTTFSKRNPKLPPSSLREMFGRKPKAVSLSSAKESKTRNNNPKKKAAQQNWFEKSLSQGLRGKVKKKVETGDGNVLAAHLAVPSQLTVDDTQEQTKEASRGVNVDFNKWAEIEDAFVEDDYVVHPSWKTFYDTKEQGQKKNKKKNNKKKNKSKKK